MARKLLTGNEALALGALHAGVKVVAGYPGTPSTRALESLLALQPEGRHVEWSTNEKVAFEIATGAAWAGMRALCTMKMSGLNVAYDSVISTAYSGIIGGLVIFVADDPGVSAGMAEQDTRGFALMSDLPMLEPASVADAYRLTRLAFDLSEESGSPVFVRLVTAISNSVAIVDVDETTAATAPLEREPRLVRDITRFTKAGPTICMNQHRDLIARLDKARAIIARMGLNRLTPADRPGGVGIIAVGITAAYLDEGLALLGDFGLERERVSILKAVTTVPYPTDEVQALLRHSGAVVVLEELEPHFERQLYVEARRVGFEGPIVGKLDGTLSRIGEYSVRDVVRAVGRAAGLAVPDTFLRADTEAESLAAARPITVCPGCPHRGTYMALNAALKKLHYRRDDVMITGDIGCTILGMNPPFNTIWLELSMGASIGLAQGYVHAGIKTPVIATIGDSTFFHAGLPALVNAVQHQVPLTLIIMDNGWTSMTGMQVNPGTAETFQAQGDRRVDIAPIVRAIGVDHFYEMDPFDYEGSIAILREAIAAPGVKVVLARQECAIQAQRRGLKAGKVTVLADKCTLCKRCIIVTGCPALTLGEEAVEIDPALCYGCGLCAAVCPFDALLWERG